MTVWPGPNDRLAELLNDRLAELLNDRLAELLNDRLAAPSLYTTTRAQCS